MSADRETLAVYDAKAAEYANLMQDLPEQDQLRTFIGALPKGASVLDLGCGPGLAAGMMAKAGLKVVATDASPEMVALAGKIDGITARVAAFDDIEGEDIYDGVWANFSLLHAPRETMPNHLAALRVAMKPGGLLHIGMKTGTGSHRDDIGRLYTYYTEAELNDLLKAAGFTPFSSKTGVDKGLAGTMDPWVTIAAHG